MSRSLVAAVLLGAAGFAAECPLATAGPEAPGAAPGDAPAASITQSRVRLGVAINPPFRWQDGDAIGASVYVGFDRHHAVRANVARYDHSGFGFGRLVGDVLSGFEYESGILDGRLLDVGVGYVYFPRELFSGFFLEAGAMLRDRDTSTENDFAFPGYVEVHSTTIAGRGHVGWSWLMYDHVFIALAVGMSVGYERGEETTSPSVYDFMPETRDVSRSSVSSEGFVRIGGAFDL